MWKIAILVLLVGCGSAEVQVDPKVQADCEAAGSTLDSNGSCVWPLFGVLPTSVNPTPGPCSGVRRGLTTCGDCHTMNSTGGWHRWPSGMVGRPSVLVTTGGCVLCHH